MAATSQELAQTMIAACSLLMMVFSLVIKYKVEMKKTLVSFYYRWTRLGGWELARTTERRPKTRKAACGGEETKARADQGIAEARAANFEFKFEFEFEFEPGPGPEPEREPGTGPESEREPGPGGSQQKESGAKERGI
ncbi:hypothetical protein BDD12DRAFT_890275 [Trichophaea hybrida]|nr:hypothetical protein BDD12DRAFT_890275 [Trichophaea hybrida]